MESHRPAPNGNRSMPRKSSTNTRALSTRIANIEQNNRQLCSFTPLRGNPPPVSNKYQLVKRRVYVAATDLTVGALSQALAGVLGDFSVEKIEARGTVAQLGSAFPSATFTLFQSVVCTGTGDANVTLPPLQCIDYGTASSMPGVTFTVPKTRAFFLTPDTGNTAKIATCSTGCLYIVTVHQQISS